MCCWCCNVEFQSFTFHVKFIVSILGLLMSKMWKSSFECALAETACSSYTWHGCTFQSQAIQLRYIIYSTEVQQFSYTSCMSQVVPLRNDDVALLNIRYPMYCTMSALLISLLTRRAIICTGHNVMYTFCWLGGLTWVAGAYTVTYGKRDLLCATSSGSGLCSYTRNFKSNNAKMSHIKQNLYKKFTGRLVGMGFPWKPQGDV